MSDIQAHNVLLCVHTPIDQACQQRSKLLPSSGKHLVSNRPEFGRLVSLKESMSRTRKFEHPYIQDGPETLTWERRQLISFVTAVPVVYALTSLEAWR